MFGDKLCGARPLYFLFFLGQEAQLIFVELPERPGLLPCRHGFGLRNGLRLGYVIGDGLLLDGAAKVAVILTN